MGAIQLFYKRNPIISVDKLVSFKNFQACCIKPAEFRPQSEGGFKAQLAGSLVFATNPLRRPRIFSKNPNSLCRSFVELVSGTLY